MTEKAVSTKRTGRIVAAVIVVILAAMIGIPAAVVHHRHAMAVCVSGFEFEGQSRVQATYLCAHGQQP